MTTSSYRFWAVFGVLCMLAAPLAHAKDAVPHVVGAEVLDADDADDAVPPELVGPAPKEVAPAAKPEVVKDEPVAGGAEKSDGAKESSDTTTAAPIPETSGSVPEKNIAIETQKAIERDTIKRDPAKIKADIANAPKPKKVSLGSLTMRSSAQQLNQLSLWRDDPKTGLPDPNIVANDVWDGTVAIDTNGILPALVMAKNAHIKEIILNIAMSAVYTPAGMTDMDYIRWRADVLMAQHHPDLAARLMNTARLGRDSGTDAQRRITYELAANKAEAACLETTATTQIPNAFWQGMNLLCAMHQHDAAAVKTLTAALTDDAMKAAAASDNDQDLPQAIFAASGFVPASKIIPDNQEILTKLADLLSDIQDADDPKLAAKQSKGQLLLLSLGALRAEKHGDDTAKLTDKALALAGF